MVSLVIAAAAVATLLAGCSQGTAAQQAKISGTVATDGSTSMEKVIGALGEAFESQNNGVTLRQKITLQGGSDQ